ncbi:DUF3231 family protein [Virgibacillus oceani]|nr:DUF3231 family protein [Virgibacillus oceani]
MAYPEDVLFVQQQQTLLDTWFGESRPLNAIELAELFFAIERNAIGQILLTGFVQVTKDNEVKEFLKKGKKLSEKQITTFNNILKNSNEPQAFPITMEVTDSTTPPFSNRLVMFFMTATNQVGISTLSNALSVSIRKDLSIHYSKFIAEIMKYGNEGHKLLIKNGWMEQPPQSANKKY